MLLRFTLVGVTYRVGFDFTFTGYVGFAFSSKEYYKKDDLFENIPIVETKRFQTKYK